MVFFVTHFFSLVKLGEAGLSVSSFFEQKWTPGDGPVKWSWQQHRDSVSDFPRIGCQMYPIV